MSCLKVDDTYTGTTSKDVLFVSYALIYLILISVISLMANILRNTKFDDDN